MLHIINISTDKREELYDVTSKIEDILKDSGVEDGLCNIFVRGATAGIMIQENWDETVQQDVVNMLRRYIPRDVWKHDEHDGNGDSHLKAGLVGPSETIPIKDNKLLLGRWQNIFLCEFDGPRDRREIVVSIIKD